MPAVLARTNLARHLGGFLLPIFEAVSNSIHSIFDKHGGASAATDGKIVVTVKDSTELDDFEVSVVDNGSGLDTAKRQWESSAFARMTNESVQDSRVYVRSG
jgi:hypothetical protein